MPSLGDALLPYTELACPKCRGQVIRRTYCDGRRGLAMSSSAICYGVSREHMHHRCERCGYERITRPADAE